VVSFEQLGRGDVLEAGLYRVDDAFGTVDGIAAGEDGYAAAALGAARATTIVPGAPLTLKGGALYAFYAVLGNGHDRGHDSGHGEDSTGWHSGRGQFQLVFSIAEANADGQDRMQASLDAQGRLTIRWDDGGNRGDDDGRGGKHGRDDCADGEAVLRASGFAAPAGGGSYAYDADASDIDGDTLVYSLAEAPAGASIDAATGLVKWTPQAPGQYRFVVRVGDGHGGSAEQAYNVDVSRAERRLYVRGSDCNDQIELSEDEGGILRVTINGATRFYSALTAIRVDALGGNDQVRLQGLTASTLVQGGAGNDKIDGSSVRVAHLELRGGEGNDDLRGGAAADLLVGDAGNDVLRGGAGDDWIIGGLGRDVLFGDAGSDVLDGNPCEDRLVDEGASRPGAAGAPPPPASMLDWSWADAASGPASGRDCRVDWNASCGSWGIAESWRRKGGFAEFGDTHGRREL
jgi:Ca2+-binding RTX toxin-like protein